VALNRILGEWKDWRLRAACRDTGPDLFFPVGLTGPAAVEDADAAKAVCRNCPVCAECLEFAMVSNQQAGVWGGATEEERRTLRRVFPSSWLHSRNPSSARPRRSIRSRPSSTQPESPVRAGTC